MNTEHKATAEQMGSLGDIKESGNNIDYVRTHIVGAECVLIGRLSDKTFFEIKENGEIEYSDY